MERLTSQVTLPPATVHGGCVDEVIGMGLTRKDVLVDIISLEELRSAIRKERSEGKKMSRSIREGIEREKRRRFYKRVQISKSHTRVSRHGVTIRMSRSFLQQRIDARMLKHDRKRRAKISTEEAA